MSKHWEDLCHCCGLCCHEKVIDDSFILFDTSAHCTYYDEESHHCTIYEKRFSLCSRCEKMTLFKAMFASWLPPGCGYVEWAKAHHLRFARKREAVFGEGFLSSLDDKSIK